MKPTRFVHVEPDNVETIETLLDVFEAHGTVYENGIRVALGLHDRPFMVQTDFISKPAITPLDDAFTFDTLTGELVIFSPEPTYLVDALLEMALFQNGFQTFMGSYKEWQTVFTIGCWRYVRESLKEDLGLDDIQIGMQLAIEQSTTARYDSRAFDAMVFLAGHPHAEVNFPPDADAMAVRAYHRLQLLMRTVGYGIQLEEAEQFNRRLARTLAWIEESVIPEDEYSVFDDLITPGGFDERFFTLGEDD